MKIYCIGHWTPALRSFTLSAVTDSLIIQGRQLSPAELQGLRQWVGENPHWSRWRLSRELATRWDWRNGAGALKDMAARSLLLKLEARGWIVLPARQRQPSNRMARRAPVVVAEALCTRSIAPGAVALTLSVFEGLVPAAL